MCSWIEKIKLLLRLPGYSIHFRRFHRETNDGKQTKGENMGRLKALRPYLWLCALVGMLLASVLMMIFMGITPQ
jgi:hypothetical protein